MKTVAPRYKEILQYFYHIIGNLFKKQIKPGFYNNHFSMLQKMAHTEWLRRTNILHNIDVEALSAQTTPQNDFVFKFY